MQVLLFAGLAERFGRRTLDLSAPLPATVAELRARLLSEWPEAANTSFRVAVNQSYAKEDMQLSASDEVALIPPVSGG